MIKPKPIKTTNQSVVQNSGQSLIDYGNLSPALPTGHPFTNVQNNWYWSASTFAGITGLAWIVFLPDGFVLHDLKGGSYRVWPVRGGQ